MEFITEINVENYSPEAEIRFAHEKLDGYYIEIYRESSAIKIFTKSRKTNLWNKLKHITTIKQQIESLPPETCLRAELWGKGIQATSIPTLINNADDRLIVSPFEMPVYAGQDSSGCSIEQVMEILSDFQLPRMIRIYADNRREKCLDSVEKWLNLATEMKIEGWVLKDRHCGNYYKLKPQRTVDAFVVGVTISDSAAFAGGLKAIQVAVFDGDKEIILASVSNGFDTKFRLSVKRDSLIGRVAEVKYQDIASNGKLKFPVFIRWRDDEKQKLECTFNQLVA